MKKSTNNFSKFTKKKSNEAIKEQFKQGKRKLKKEREEFFDNKRRSRFEEKKPGSSAKDPSPVNIQRKTDLTEKMPLNKFIAHSGVTGRREAAELVKKGLVKVNGAVISEPGHKVTPADEIRVNGKRIHIAKNLVYILLNKPKDYITT